MTPEFWDDVFFGALYLFIGLLFGTLFGWFKGYDEATKRASQLDDERRNP